MTPEAWIAFAALMVTLLVVSAGGLWALFNQISRSEQGTQKLIKNYIEAADKEFERVKNTANLEYKDIRNEISSKLDKAYRELSEPAMALREKLNQVELWMRDNLLPRKEYERDQDQVLAQLKSLQDIIERRFSALEKRMEEDRKQK